MSASADIFRRLSRPLEPIPTGVEPQLNYLPGIRAALFDIYGTLLISGSGDIGSINDTHRADAANAALAAVGIEVNRTPEDVVDILAATIARHHTAANNRGIEYPEVDIVRIWRDTLGEVVADDRACEALVKHKQLACEFEARANPVWPMPGLESVLMELDQRHVLLGIVSNAQFFTPALFPALLSRSLDELGVDPSLRYYSYEHRHAKPSPWMYRQARETLASRGVQPAEVLYVGNDLRNDVWPAMQVGFRTALFAGDARSLRLRGDDSRLADVTPDAIVANLGQVLELIHSEPCC